MISQAGPRYEGDIPFTAAAVDDFGLIEIYETVLKQREWMLSIFGQSAGELRFRPTMHLLLAASRLSDLVHVTGQRGVCGCFPIRR